MSLLNLVYRVIDSETSVDGVCEVAYRDIRADGTVLAQFQALCNPGRAISPGAAAVHHLTDADVAGKPPYSEIKATLVAPVYVAHNANFDKSFLNLPGDWLCTSRLSKHLLPDVQSHSNELRYHLKLDVDLPKDTASHRAAADVAVTAALFVHLLPLAMKRWPIATTPALLAAAVDGPAMLTYIPFTKHRGKLFNAIDDGFLRWIVEKQAGGPDCVHTARIVLSARSGRSA